MRLLLLPMIVKTGLRLSTPDHTRAIIWLTTLKELWITSLWRWNLRPPTGGSRRFSFSIKLVENMTMVCAHWFVHVCVRGVGVFVLVLFCSTWCTAQQCTQDSTGTVLVPIVVAVALGVLIIVVVAAYLVSYVYHRKKSGSYEALNWTLWWDFRKRNWCYAFLFSFVIVGTFCLLQEQSSLPAVFVCLFTLLKLVPITSVQCGPRWNRRCRGSGPKFYWTQTTFFRLV